MRFWARVSADCLWTGPYVTREQEALADLRADIVILDGEEQIAFGVVDGEELQGAQSVLSNLDYVLSRAGPLAYCKPCSGIYATCAVGASTVHSY